MSSSVNVSPTSVAVASTRAGVWTASLSLPQEGVGGGSALGGTWPPATTRLSSLGVWLPARDKCQSRLRALDRMACRDVIGIPREHQQLRVRDHLLPGACLVDGG
jgi:hypothetical protein